MLKLAKIFEEVRLVKKGTYIYVARIGHNHSHSSVFREAAPELDLISFKMNKS